MTRFFIAALCLASATFVGGCKPKAGASCKIEAKEVCIGDKQALVCHDSKWEEMTCRGPSGCSKSSDKNGNDSTCDQAVAEDKEVCNLAQDYVCSADKKGMLECTKNRWTFVQSCLGDRGCAMEQKKVTCDNSIASIGDPCREEDDYACSPTKKSALVCRGGKFILANNCNGKNQCRVTGDKNTGFKVECDDSVATIGDPCDKEGHFACSLDEKQIVRCTSKKFVGDEKCRKTEKCTVKGDLVGCY